jgi:glycosyltransferase involved in cell wall biosynthesis
MTRIAVIGHGLWGQAIRVYPAVYIHLLHKGLIAMDRSIRCFYITNIDTRQGPTFSVIDGIEVYHTRLTLTGKEVVKTAIALRPDVISVHGGFLSLILAQRLASSVGRPTVFTLHYERRPTWALLRDWCESRAFRRLYLPGYLVPGAFLRRVCAGITRLAAPTARIAEVLSQVAGEQEVEVVPPPLDVDYFSPEREYDLGPVTRRPDTARPTVLYFGSADRQRGLPLLIRAVQQAGKHLPELLCVLLVRHLSGPDAGTGVPNGIRREIAHAEKLFLLVNENVVDVRPFLSMADIVALPFLNSYATAVPYTLLEAMSMAKPVITTRVGSTNGLVEDGEDSVIVPPSDVGALKNAMLALFAQPSLRAQLGLRARQRVIQRNCLTRVCGILKELYDDVR